MHKRTSRAGAYEIATLFAGTAIASGSLFAYATPIGKANHCGPLFGDCVPVLFLLLISFEIAGILLATILSSVKDYNHAAVWLPHGALIIGVTVALFALVR